MFRGHTRWFSLIKSNVRKSKHVLIWPFILYFIRFFGGGGVGSRGAGPENMRAAVLC